MKKALDIFFYSELINSRSGVVTWLKYFLKELEKINHYSSINIYMIKPRNKSESLISHPEYKNINFYITDIGIPERNNPFFNITKWAWSSLKAFKKQTSKNEERELLFISTLPSAVILFLMNLFFKNNNQKVLWVRSKALGELATYRNNLYVKIASLLENYAFHKFDKIITNGTDTYNYYLSIYENKNSKIFKVSNAINAEELFKLKYPEYKDEIRIAYLGRLNEAKGFSYFLKSAELAKNEQTLSFHVYGEGDYNKEIETVKFYGAYDQNMIKEILEKNDVIVFLNRENFSGGLSHSLLEAMAAGRIIVAWNNNVHCQVLNDTNSWLVPEGDVEGLYLMYKKIQDIWKNNPKEILEKCIEARKESLKYSPHEHVKKYLEIMDRKR